MIHFSWDISLGQIVTLLAIVGGIWRVERAYNLYSIEHEMLMVDYCNRFGIRLHNLPTRSKGAVRISE